MCLPLQIKATMGNRTGFMSADVRESSGEANTFRTVLKMFLHSRFTTSQALAPTPGEDHLVCVCPLRGF